MTTDLSTAFEKLVDISQEQTQLMTEHNMLLKQLHDRLSSAEERHTKSVIETREVIKAAIKVDGDARDRWFKRATMVLIAIISLGTLFGTGSAGAAVVLRLLGLTH